MLLDGLGPPSLSRFHACACQVSRSGLGGDTRETIPAQTKSVSRPHLCRHTADPGLCSRGNVHNRYGLSPCARIRTTTAWGQKEQEGKPWGGCRRGVARMSLSDGRREQLSVLQVRANTAEPGLSAAGQTYTSFPVLLFLHMTTYCCRLAINNQRQPPPGGLAARGDTIMADAPPQYAHSIATESIRGGIDGAMELAGADHGALSKRNARATQ